MRIWLEGGQQGGERFVTGGTKTSRENMVKGGITGKKYG
jgi:hypothetical protein